MKTSLPVALLLAVWTFGLGMSPRAGAVPSPAEKERIWYVTQPPYPYAARETQDQGHGEVLVTTDAQGKIIAARMKVSTGSRVLDDNTIYHALKWHGPPNGTKAISIGYELTNGQPRSGKIKAFTPLPPYPAAARHMHLQGSGLIHFTTNASGNVVRAEMQRSTGSPTLDENTVNYAKAKWRGLPNQEFSVPITYLLR